MGTEVAVLQIGRRILVFGALVSTLLMNLEPPAIAGGRAGANPAAPIPAATILAAPEKYEGKEVVIRGAVVKANRAVFPNGRPYYTLLIGDGRATLTMFSWARPPVKEGDLVEAVGVFHVWRYNIRHMIESTLITRLEK